MELENYIQTIDGKTPVGPNYFPARGSRKFIVGVDLGQSSDPTAICVLEHAKVPSRNWKVQERAGAPRIKRQQLERGSKSGICSACRSACPIRMYAKTSRTFWRGLRSAARLIWSLTKPASDAR